ncbi:MAG: hypothetical protein IID15_07805, partial [Candidatus Marinimicrobia bacterium]|nr:hypothetical protein [Candidatus Neomarinimicrobiota bacterium]
MASTAGMLIYALTLALVTWRLARWLIFLRRSATILNIVGNEDDDFSIFPAGVVEQTLEYPHPGGTDEPCRKIIPKRSRRKMAM